MKSLIFKKVKIARESLNLSQISAAEASGYSQSGISLLENGENTFIPNEYLSFLATKGINLTAIFDEDLSLDDFALSCGGFFTHDLHHKVKNLEVQLQLKDREVELLSKTIQSMEITIKALQQLTNIQDRKQ